MTSPNAEKDPGTTRIADLARNSDRTIATGMANAVDSLREIIEVCGPLCNPWSENIVCACILAHVYRKLSFLLETSGCHASVAGGSSGEEWMMLLMKEALEYALALEEMLNEVETSADKNLQAEFYSTFLSWYKKQGMLSDSGSNAVQRMRAGNYRLLCSIVDQVNMPYDESRKWNQRLCEYVWHCLHGSAEADSIFWGNMLMDACRDITNMLKKEGQTEKAETISRKFLMGEISGLIKGNSEVHWRLRATLQEAGFQWLMELYLSVGKYEKAKMLLEWKLSQ